jgi:stalled ribosome rescue protein Dom34
MTTGKKLGIWLDHSTAHLIELATELGEVKIIESKFTHDEKEHSLSKSESLMHHKEQRELTAYYKELMEKIKNYDEVLLFGPTTAKEELANLLKADHRFEKIKVETKGADKMTTNQQYAFVKEHFYKAI